MRIQSLRWASIQLDTAESAPRARLMLKTMRTDRLPSTDRMKFGSENGCLHDEERFFFLLVMSKLVATQV